MNLTQRTIILVGNDDLLRKALSVIKGFKAVTIVNQPTDDIIQNIFAHNKNAVIARNSYDLSLSKYNPVVINVGTQETNIEILRLGIKNIKEDFPKLLDTQDIDVGDHVSEDSTDSKAVQCNCMLCKIMDGNPDHEHILYESDNFFVIPGLGAFFKGYCMIIPKAHVMSFAELSKQQYEEFLHVLNDMRFILESVYHKKIFTFECGSGRNGGGKHATSIVHAHVHLAPTDMPVLSSVMKTGLYPAQILPNDLRKYGKYPYMLYIDQDDNWFITQDPDTYFPRQHPRQVLADYMGLAKGEYNWRTNPLREELDIVADEILGFIKSNFRSLPKWIQKSTEKYI